MTHLQAKIPKALPLGILGGGGGGGGVGGGLVHRQTAVNQRSLRFFLRSDYVYNAGFFTQNQL